MPLGTYVIDGTTSAQNNFFGTNSTVCNKGTFSQSIKLVSVALRFYSTGTFNGKIVVYDNSGNLIASSATQSLTVSDTTSYYEIPLTSPVILSASVVYKIGYWNGSGAMPGVVNPTSAQNYASSPSYSTFSKESTLVYSTSDSNPTVTSSYENVMKMYFNLPNEAPVVTSGTPFNSTVYTGATNRFSWTHTDAESNPQTKYEVGYKKRLESTWTTTGELTSANQYHDFAAGTFVDGQYQWRVRVHDGTNWSEYFHFYFDATTFIETAEFTSTAQTHTIDATSRAEGPIDIQVRVADANGWGAWEATSFTLGPASNIMVLQGGVWVQAENLVKEGGAFKTVSPTESIYYPEKVTGLFAMYDSLYPLGKGASRPANGTVISQWNDLSGNDRHLSQTDPTKRPVYKTDNTNGIPVLNFTGDYLDTALFSSFLAQPITVYAVSYSSGPAGQVYQHIFDGTNTHTCLFIRDNSYNISNGRYEIHAGATVASGVYRDLTKPIVTSAVFNTTSSSISMNGLTPGVGNGGTAGLNALRVGAEWNTPASPWQGGIYTLLIYTGVHDAGTRASIEQSLANRFGVTLS